MHGVWIAASMPEAQEDFHDGARVKPFVRFEAQLAGSEGKDGAVREHWARLVVKGSQSR